MIIELRAGVFLFYPSSLFQHWNIDAYGMLFVCHLFELLTSDCSMHNEDAPGLFTTEDGKPFDPAHAQKFERTKYYRYSYVWFSQATMYKAMEDANATQTTWSNLGHMIFPANEVVMGRATA
jgi:hypothetical protein